MFLIGQARVAEAVGVFDTPQQAPQRMKDERPPGGSNVFAVFFGPKDRVKVFSPQVARGSATKVPSFRYRITGEGSQPEGYADVLSIQRPASALRPSSSWSKTTGPPDSIRAR